MIKHRQGRVVAHGRYAPSDHRYINGSLCPRMRRRQYHRCHRSRNHVQIFFIYLALPSIYLKYPMSRFFDPQRIQRLVAFGDSWTAGHGVETDPRYRDIARPEPFVHNLRLSNSWPRWLAQALDIPFVNLAEAGICNVGIKRSIENHRPWIDPDTDLVPQNPKTPHD